VDEQCKACTVLYCSNIEIVDSNHFQDIDAYLHFSVFALSCVSGDLTKG
jgi:hypothetical protein